MTTMVLILGKTADAPMPWGLFERGKAGARQIGVQQVTERFAFNPADAPDTVWVVVPGVDVITRAVEIPAQTDSRARQAAAFALEDDLAIDGEDMHFALSDATAQGPRLVAAVAHDTMRAWQAQLEAIGLSPNVLVPDYAALGAASGEAVVIDHAGMAIVQGAAPGLGFALEHESLEWVLEEALSGAKSVRIMSADADTLRAGPLQSLSKVARYESLSDAKVLEMAFAALSGGPAINLLQGPYAPRRKWRPALRLWRRAGILASAAALAGVAVLVADGVRLNRHAESALARAEAVFRRTLPDVKRVVNPRSQIRAHLQDLKARASTGFLSTSAILFSAVSDIDNAEIETLRFDAKRGESSATMSLPSYDAMERLKSGITSRGGIVQEGGARQDGERIMTDIIVRLP